MSDDETQTLSNGDVAEEVVKQAINQAETRARDVLAAQTATALELIAAKAAEALDKLAAQTATAPELIAAKAAEALDRLAADAARASRKVAVEAAEAREEPTGRVTNRDLFNVNSAVHERCNTIERGIGALTERISHGFTGLADELRDLRGVANDQMHAMDAKIDRVAEDLKPIKREWDMRNALAKIGWKSITSLILVAGFVGAAIDRIIDLCK